MRFAIKIDMQNNCRISSRDAYEKLSVVTGDNWAYLSNTYPIPESCDVAWPARLLAIRYDWPNWDILLFYTYMTFIYIHVHVRLFRYSVVTRRYIPVVLLCIEKSYVSVICLWSFTLFSGQKLTPRFKMETRPINAGWNPGANQSGGCLD